jgi:hypothetical protein
MSTSYSYSPPSTFVACSGTALALALRKECKFRSRFNGITVRYTIPSFHLGTYGVYDAFPSDSIDWQAFLHTVMDFRSHNNGEFYG